PPQIHTLSLHDALPIYSEELRETRPLADSLTRPLASQSSVLSPQSFHVVAYDFGIKRNILRLLVSRGCRVTVVPADTPAREVLADRKSTRLNSSHVKSS